MTNILLIEDEVWLGELYVQLLSGQYTVSWARDGYDALDMLGATKPDLILLDIMLPWGNGIQLLHEFVSYDDTARIPVVIFSAALPSTIDESVLRAYGVAALLDKTTTKPRQVLQTIKGILRAHAKLSN